MPKKKQTKLKDPVVPNYYEIIDKRFISQSAHNPQYGKNHFIKTPFRGLICGGSGSGKNNLLLHLLKAMDSTFQELIIICKQPDQPLYEFLRSKQPDTKFYDITRIPPLSTLNPSTSKLVVFDDILIEKDQSVVMEYFIRSRHLNCSCLYLTQSAYARNGALKKIRLQCTDFFILKLSSRRDLRMFLSEFTADQKKIEEYYDYSTKEKFSFLHINIETGYCFKNLTEKLN